MTGTPTLTNVADVYPLTPAQEGMLFHTVAAAGTDVYVSQVITTISGDLDTDLFERAWAAVVEQYACLRTAFLWDGLDAPLQVVRETVELAWEHVDLRDVELSRQADRVEAILAEDRARGFDLAVAPVSRMLMIRTADTEWTWVWTVHHLVADGWSDQILMDAVAAAYRDLVDGNHVGVAPEPMPYRRYVEFVKQRDVSIDEAHWRQRLAGFVGSALPDVPGLPPETDEIRYRTHDTVIESATTRALEALARSHRVTLNTVVTAMWGVLMSRWLRSDDVVIGTTASGRPPTLAGVDRAAGMFINTIPTRMQIPQRARLSEWLPELQRTATTDRDHQLASLADIHRWSDVPAGDPLFESILVFENYPTSDDRTLGPSITLGDTAYREHSNYPLALLVIPDDELGLTFVFDESRCSPAAIESLSAQMRHVAAAFVADDDANVASLEVTDPHPPGDTAPWLDGPALPDSTGTTCDAILEHAERTPHATAVAFGDETLSYEALADASEAIARRLIAAGAAGSRVGLHAERSIGLIVGMLGILRAGAAYVPLDPS